MLVFRGESPAPHWKSGIISQKPAPEKLGMGFFFAFFETQNDDVMVVGVVLPKLVDDT